MRAGRCSPPPLLGESRHRWRKEGHFRDESSLFQTGLEKPSGVFYGIADNHDKTRLVSVTGIKVAEHRFW